VAKKVYFNESFPENQNIRITNTRSKFSSIYDGESFIYHPKKKLLNKLIIDGVNIMDDIYENNEYKKSCSYKEFEKKFYDGNASQRYRLMKETECVILNECKRLNLKNIK
jgi:hypothetical protein